MRLEFIKNKLTNSLLAKILPGSALCSQIISALVLFVVMTAAAGNLGYVDEDVFTAKKPENLNLPKVNVTSSYAFAINDYFFAYPNNYNYYVNYYKDTFQHGGVSMEEMVIPIISLTSKNG